MEIVKRASEGAHKFKVIRAFRWGGKMAEVGEIIEIKDQGEQGGYVQRGKTVPCDLPAVGVYIALRSFILPGKKEKFEAKAMELVEIKSEDALALLLQGLIIPKDDSQWRPLDRRLKKSPAGRGPKG